MRAAPDSSFLLQLLTARQKENPQVTAKEPEACSDARLSPYHEGPRWDWEPSQPARSPPPSVTHRTHHGASEGAALGPRSYSPGSFPTSGKANPDGN